MMTCTNHPDRRAVRHADGQPVCLACWRERREQAPITRDTALIARAPLDEHERYVLLRRAERTKQ
jgi:hypothetical protein